MGRIIKKKGFSKLTAKLLLACMTLGLLLAVPAFAENMIAAQTPLVSDAGVMTVSGKVNGGSVENVYLTVYNSDGLDDSDFSLTGLTATQIMEKVESLNAHVVITGVYDVAADGTFSIPVDLAAMGMVPGTPFKVILRTEDMSAPKMMNSYYAESGDVNIALTKLASSDAAEVKRIFASDYQPDYDAGEIPYASVLGLDVSGYYDVLATQYPSFADQVCAAMAGGSFSSITAAMNTFDSAVEAAAKAGIPFGHVATSQSVPVNVSDLVAALRAVGTDYKLTPTADVDMNGIINLEDAQLIADYITGVITEF